jgi:hypothetical protein
MHENPVFANKSLKVKSKNKFCRFFFYIPKGEAFMYIILKNQHCAFILSVFFCGEIETCYTLFVHLCFVRW